MAGTPASSRAAGLLTEIFDSELGADAASFDVTGIAADFVQLWGFVTGRTTDAAVQLCLIRFNNDSGANYQIQELSASGAALVGAESAAQTAGRLGFLPGTDAAAGLAGSGEFVVAGYAGTTFRKIVNARQHLRYGAGPTSQETLFGTAWASTAAINRVTLLPAAGNFLAGSRLTLYGVG